MLVKLPKKRRFTLRLLIFSFLKEKLVISGCAEMIANITEPSAVISSVPTGISNDLCCANSAPVTEVLVLRYVITTDNMIAFKLIIMLALLSAMALKLRCVRYVFRNMVSMPRFG